MVAFDFAFILGDYSAIVYFFKGLHEFASLSFTDYFFFRTDFRTFSVITFRTGQAGIIDEVFIVSKADCTKTGLVCLLWYNLY
jgi:hypothetical protein